MGAYFGLDLGVCKCVSVKLRFIVTKSPFPGVPRTFAGYGVQLVDRCVWRLGGVGV